MLRVERKLSSVGVERIVTDSPVAVWDGHELRLGIGEVLVPALAFEVATEIEDYSVDFVATALQSIVYVLGESRIDHVVVFERQSQRMIQMLTDRNEKKLLRSLYCHHGRYGFVAYLK